MNAITQQWWNNFGNFTKKLFQIRHFPATNWEYLNSEQIQFIYNKEKI